MATPAYGKGKAAVRQTNDDNAMTGRWTRQDSHLRLPHHHAGNNDGCGLAGDGTRATMLPCNIDCRRAKGQ